MSNKPDEALQSTSSNRNTALSLGEAEDGALAGNAHVEVNNKLAPASEGNTVDRDDGLAERSENCCAWVEGESGLSHDGG